MEATKETKFATKVA